MRARLGRRDVGAEAQHHGALLRVDGVDPRQHPQQREREGQQARAAGRQPARAVAPALETRLQPLEHLVHVRHAAIAVAGLAPAGIPRVAASAARLIPRHCANSPS